MIKQILLCCAAVVLMLIPYAFGDEWDRLIFGEGNVAHCTQNTGYWKSEKEKKKFIRIYVFWHLLLVGIIVGTLYG